MLDTLRKKRIFRLLARYEGNPSQWQIRSIAVLNFDDGQDTYVESRTIDLDVSKLKPVGRKRYIHVGWRSRFSFLDFSCQTLSGASMRLMPLCVRREYAEYLVWRYIKELNNLRDRDIPGCLRGRMHRVVAGQGRGGSCVGCSKDEHKAHFDLWRNLTFSQSIQQYIKLVSENDPLILEVSSKEDVSIIKLAERKSHTPVRPTGRYMRLERWRQYLLFGRLERQYLAPAATLSKVIASPDIRLNGSLTFSFRSNGEANDQCDVFGEGSALVVPATRPPAPRLWVLNIRPRRSFLITPGIFILLFSFLTSLLWLLVLQESAYSASVARYVLLCDPSVLRVCGDAGEIIIEASGNKVNFQTLVKDVAIGLPYGALYSYFLTQFHLFQGLRSRSYLYQISLRPHYRLLGASMILAILFPFVKHVVDNFIPEAFGLSLPLSGEYLQVLILIFLGAAFLIFLLEKSRKVRLRIASSLRPSLINESRFV